MTAPERAKAITAMLASDHDGEVLNAARALVRFAASLGLSVQDLVSIQHPKPAPAHGHQDQPQRASRNGYSTADVRAAYEAHKQYVAASARAEASGHTYSQKDLDELVAEVTREKNDRSAWFRWRQS